MNTTCDMTPTEADRQFDNQLNVPDWQLHVQRWQHESERFIAAHPDKVGARYGTGSAERLDLFLPRHESLAGARREVLVFLHGGYWHRGDRRLYAFVAAPFLAAGIAVAFPGYRLFPQAQSLDDPISDVERAVLWVEENLATRDGAAPRIWLGGHSAGAHLAAMQFTRGTAAIGSVLLSGLYDLAPLMPANFLEGQVRFTQNDAADRSPALRVPTTGTRHLIAVGADETEGFRTQSRRLGESWRMARTLSIELPGANHFTVVDALADADSALARSAIEFIHA